ncbi:hypothetical protein LCGC14_0865130 [marine sediment metagenome]|uniref:Uncharacterized protein n=1 Tax=marine sediment metagenome TaxID=412755 RepID=A0A0F9P6A2_9ZZZZ
MAAGDISAVIDTLVLTGCTTPRMVVLDGDYVVVSAWDGSLHGHIHTFTVDNVGAISDTVVDTWDFASTGLTPDIIKIPGSSDKYVIGYEGAASEGFIKSIIISTTGVITESFIDTVSTGARIVYGYVLHTEDANDTLIAQCFAGVVETVTVDSSGNIGAAVIDSEDYGHPGVPGNVIEIASGYYATIYADNLETFSIDGAGNITAVDSWDWTASTGTNSRIVKVPDSTKYMIAYENGSNDGIVFSFTISNTGIITKSVIDSLTFEPGINNWVSPPLSLGSDYFAIAGVGNADGFDGVIYTFTCDSDGAISDTVSDTMEFYDGSVNFCQAPFMIHVQDDVYAVAHYRQSSFDGWVRSFTIEIPTGAVEETATFSSDSHIWDAETATFNSNSHLYAEDTEIFSSTSHLWDTITATFSSNSNIHDTETETGTFTSNSHLYAEDTVTVQSDARIISQAQIENEYKIPWEIHPTMRNIHTTPQTGGQDDGGFRIL